MALFPLLVVVIALAGCAVWVLYKRSANKQNVENLEKNSKNTQMNSDVIFCSECGVPLAGNERFCGKCGAEVLGF
jgi:hypothetical protein